MLQSGSTHQPPITCHGPRRSVRGSARRAPDRSPRPTGRRNRVAGEHEVRVLLHPVDRRLEGRAHLLVALGPLPQPHGVDVGVADHVQALGHARAAHASTCSRIRWSRSTCISCTRAVSLDGTTSAWSAWSAAGCPRRRRTGPSSRRTPRAAASPRTTFAERPLVLKAIATSPPRTKPRTCRSKTSSNE